MTEASSSPASCGSTPFLGRARVVTIEATPAEREALASFYRLPAIAALTATLRARALGPRRGARHRRRPRRVSLRPASFRSSPFPATVDEDGRRAVRAADGGQFRIAGGQAKRRRFPSPMKTSPIP